MKKGLVAKPSKPAISTNNGGIIGLSVTKAPVSSNAEVKKKSPTKSSRTSPLKKPATPAPRKGSLPSTIHKKPATPKNPKKTEKQWVGKIKCVMGLHSGLVPVRHDGLGDSDIHVRIFLLLFLTKLESSQVG
jgi:hypothetical protein